MQYKELYYLLALQEEELLSLAAKKLDISQSSLSLYLQRLEKRLGTELYDRSQHRLTQAGEIFCSGAAKILSLHEKAVEDIRGLAAVNALMLGIDLRLMESAPEALPRLIERFNLRYPDIAVQSYFMMEGPLKELLQHNKLDLAYCYQSGDAQPLQRIAVATENLLLAFPRGSAPEEGSPCELLRRMKYIAMFKNTSIRTVTDAALFHYGITPRLSVESESYELTCRLMKTGGYVTIIPASVRSKFADFEFYRLKSAFRAVSGFYVQSKNSYLPHISYLMELIARQSLELNGTNEYVTFFKGTKK